MTYSSPTHQDERQEMCNFSSHSRSGWTTLYRIYRLVMGSWRQTVQADRGPSCAGTAPVGAAHPTWNPAHRGLTAASPLPPPPGTETTSSQGHSPWGPHCPEGATAQREPTSSEPLPGPRGLFLSPSCGLSIFLQTGSDSRSLGQRFGNPQYSKNVAEVDPSRP